MMKPPDLIQGIPKVRSPVLGDLLEQRPGHSQSRGWRTLLLQCIIWSWLVFSSPLLREKKEEVPPNGIFTLLEGPFLVILASHHSPSSAWALAASTNHLHTRLFGKKKINKVCNRI